MLSSSAAMPAPDMSSKHAIEDIKDFSDPAAQIAALKRLKNESIGHLEKRESLLKAGLLASLAHALEACAKLRGKQRDSSTNGAPFVSLNPPCADPDEISYQALTLLASIAQGGSSFAAPIESAGLLPILVSLLSPSDTSPKVVSASLKTLIAIANAEYDSTLQSSQHHELVELCLSKPAITAFTHILASRSHSVLARQQASLVCQIIQRTVATDEHRALLESHGIINHLASHLASYYIHNHPRSSHLFNLVVGPLPAPPSVQHLAYFLGALNAIVTNSRYRVATLLFSPTIFSVLPFVQSLVRVEPKIHQPSQQSAYDVSPRDLSLPWVHSRIEKADSGSFSRAFPTLGASVPALTVPGRSQPPLIDFADVAPTPDKSHSPLAGTDSAFVSWLIHITRTTKGLCRVNAAALIVSIARGGYVSGIKDRSLALLVVPLLVDILKQAQYSHGSLQAASNQNPFQSSELLALCEAPRILAALLEEIPTLQRAAIEAGVVKELCQFLKSTFASIEAHPPLWSANPDTTEMEQELDPMSTLGEKGVSANVVWLFRCREHGLLLLAALASKEDQYRKKLCDNGMVQCIIDSLAPFQDSSLRLLRAQASSSRKEKLDAKLGNPQFILLAACKAATAMSRSVSLLRTSLIDAGLAKPVYALVKHSSVEVVIAATSVVCNLMMEFSPMRHDIVEAGAIKTLCEHAHNADSRVRSASLWALKHLVSQAPNEVKTACIEELGTGWLDKIIAGGPGAHSSAKLHPFGIGAANARGERVDILRPQEDDAMKEPGGATSTSLGTSFASDFSARHLDDRTPPIAGARTPPTQQQGHAAYLADVKRAEDAHAAGQPARDTLRIQVHALDFVRNVTTGPGANDMIDYLYAQLGTQRVYDLIAAKLRPAPDAPPADAADADAAAVARHAPAQLLTSAIYTLSHIAASAPRNRQHLIGQTPLLALLRALFRYPDQEVRSSCLWVALNLMWIDDSSDSAGARGRAAELRRLGFGEEIEARLRDDCFDVQERARTAWDLIDGERGSGAGAARR